MVLAQFTKNTGATLEAPYLPYPTTRTVDVTTYEISFDADYSQARPSSVISWTGGDLLQSQSGKPESYNEQWQLDHYTKVQHGIIISTGTLAQYSSAYGREADYRSYDHSSSVSSVVYDMSWIQNVAVPAASAMTLANYLDGIRMHAVYIPSRHVVILEHENGLTNPVTQVSNIPYGIDIDVAHGDLPTFTTNPVTHIYLQRDGVMGMTSDAQPPAGWHAIPSDGFTSKGSRYIEGNRVMPATLYGGTITSAFFEPSARSLYTVPVTETGAVLEYRFTEVGDCTLDQSVFFPYLDALPSIHAKVYLYGQRLYDEYAGGVGVTYKYYILAACWPSSLSVILSEGDLDYSGIGGLYAFKDIVSHTPSIAMIPAGTVVVTISIGTSYNAVPLDNESEYCMTFADTMPCGNPPQTTTLPAVVPSIAKKVAL